MAGQITIAGLAGGLNSGYKVIGPLTVSGTAVIGQVTDVVLGAGDATVAIPTGATGFVFVPPIPGPGSITFRTVNGDSGTYISPSNPFMWSFDPSNMPTNLIFHVVSPASGFAEITFI